MGYKKATLIGFLALFLYSLIYKVSLILNLPIQTDEISFLSMTLNNTIDKLMPAYPFAAEDIITLSEALKPLTHPLPEYSYLSDSMYFMLHFPEITNHPPLSFILAKPFTYVSATVMSLRFYSLLAFALTLPLLFKIQKRLFIKDINTRYLVLAIYSSFTLVSLSATYAKGYAAQTLFVLLSLYFFLRSFKETDYDSNSQSQKLEEPGIRNEDLRNENNTAMEAFETERDVFYQSIKKQEPTVNLLIALVLAHMAFSIHYFSLPFLLAFYITVSFTYKYFFNVKVLKRHYLYLVVFLSSHMLYLPLLKLQSKATSSYFSGSSSFIKEIREGASTFAHFLSLNYEKTLSVLILIGLAVLIYFHKDKIRALLFLSLAAIPIFTISAIDIVTKQHLIDASRYALVSLIFVAILLGLLFENKLRLALMVLLPLLSANMLFTKSQHKKMLNGSPKKLISFAKELSASALDQKTLVIVRRLTANNMIFLYHLKEALKDQPEKEANLYFTASKSSKASVLAAVKESGIKKIIIPIKKENHHKHYQHLMPLDMSGVEIEIRELY